MEKQYKMPSVQQFLDRKTITLGPKKEPVWVYLEREMLLNADKKPYNETVGNWLKFLKDLKYYYFCESRRKERRVQREVGPAWYCELSSNQREVLTHLKADIHQDLLEDLPNRVRQSLSDLGVTLKIPKSVLMRAMHDSVEDPGVFIWNLYTAIYKTSPSELRKHYEMNAMLLMSSLVFIDLEECVQRLEQLTAVPKLPPSPAKPKKNKYFQPNVRYGDYLQKSYVPLYSNHSSGEKKAKQPLPLGSKLRLRSDKSYTALCNNLGFLEMRKNRNRTAKEAERICTYKFWEAPSTLRNTDPKMAAYVNKLKMIKMKARAKHKSQYKNLQYHVGGVAYTGGKPCYLLSNVVLLPTGYIPINGGIAMVEGEYVLTILGYWKFPRIVKEKCETACNCLEKWGGKVMEYLQDSKCKCGHLYDYHNEGKTKEKFFHPPTRHGSYWIDKAKVYQMDPSEDFIKETIHNAMLSADATPEPSNPTLSAAGLKMKDLLAAFLADLTDTPLVIPHLPQANLLNNLQEWVRKRVKGKLTPQEHKQFILKSQRRWLDLKHMDFRARAFKIPFTLKELENMTWSHRALIMKLFHILLEDFVGRNRMKQLEQTRLWWSTTKYDAYPSKPFLDIFFTYMPGRMKDTFIINPHNSKDTPQVNAKTCPLD